MQSGKSRPGNLLTRTLIRLHTPELLLHSFWTLSEIGIRLPIALVSCAAAGSCLHAHFRSIISRSEADFTGNSQFVCRKPAECTKLLPFRGVLRLLTLILTLTPP